MKQSLTNFDIIVVGGGHAGTEAAAAAARMGAKTALLSQNLSTIGAMSCNPAMGGLGKGHLIREVDAMDGLIGRAADAASIQFRLLNRRKGPAVQGPRIQADRKLYRKAIHSLLDDTDNLVLIEDECKSIIIKDGAIGGIITKNTEFLCGALILTTGTFLNGRIHRGDASSDGGRLGHPAVKGLSDQLRTLGFKISRLKTGTPPRIDGRSIDFNQLEMQWGDDEPQFLSSLTNKSSACQVPCFITRTNDETHKIVRSSLSRSALFSGSITGPGPRYCPSIEDKIVRFADRDSHQIFLEPEGLDTSLIYPNGISTSLPADAQQSLVNSITGLKNAKITEFGYAIEYDYVNPQELTPCLMTHKIKGLFLAGQINGTTGYEEAAAQGLVAGIGAARYLYADTRPIFDRTNSYIGVMVDDLIIKGVTEPYRMFTSRAEYRLSLRTDNADERLTPIGIELGVVKTDRALQYHQIKQKLCDARQLLAEIVLPASKIREAGCEIVGPDQVRSIAHWASNSNVSLKHLTAICPELKAIASPLLPRLEADAKYRDYLIRQSEDVVRQRSDERLVIPDGFDYKTLPGLSNELKAKLDVLRPATVGHASRMEGITPAALMLLAAHARRLREPTQTFQHR